MKGFEPLHRQNRPTGFRIRTLQPLGYISVFNFQAPFARHSEKCENSMQDNRNLGGFLPRKKPAVTRFDADETASPEQPFEFYEGLDKQDKLRSELVSLSADFRRCSGIVPGANPHKRREYKEKRDCPVLGQKRQRFWKNARTDARYDPTKTTPVSR